MLGTSICAKDWQHLRFCEVNCCLLSEEFPPGLLSVKESHAIIVGEKKANTFTLPGLNPSAPPQGLDSIFPSAAATTAPLSTQPPPSPKLSSPWVALILCHREIGAVKRNTIQLPALWVTNSRLSFLAFLSLPSLRLKHRSVLLWVTHSPLDLGHWSFGPSPSFYLDQRLYSCIILCFCCISKYPLPSPASIECWLQTSFKNWLFLICKTNTK